MIFMDYSIQEYLKKINSWLSFYDCLSIFATALCVLLLSLYMYGTAHANTIETTYISNQNSEIMVQSITSNDSRPFASRKGKTYTFSWCSGSSRIASKNKIFFQSETEAQQSGRTLSKLCKR